jgi:hypothetical protein
MDMATENDTLPAPIGPTAQSIADRITAERARLSAEEATERELIARRKAILTDADDATIDEVELKIGSSRSKQLRLIERIDVLGQQLVAANKAAESASLDALAAKAGQARIVGESLIREYAKAAAPLVGILQKLAAVEELISRSNERLYHAGRPAIESPNAIRCRPAKEYDRTVTKRVGINQPEHPHFGQQRSRSNDGMTSYLKDGGQCPTFMDVDVTERVHERAERPEPIHEVTHLPGIEVPETDHCSLPLYDSKRTKQNDADVVKLEAELDSGAISKIGKVASKLLGAK